MKVFRKGKRFPAWASLGMACVLAVGAGFAGVEARGQAAVSQDEALREELERAKREIERLKEENARLKGQPLAPAPAPAEVLPVPGQAPAIAGGPAVAPVSGAAKASGVTGEGMVVVPAPIPEGETVTALQLLADYRTSALAGDARYKGRRFRVEGTVQSFKKSFLGLSWDVLLQGGDSLGQLRCRTSFPGISDFRGEGSSILEGRRPFRAWQSLLSKGGKLTLEGLCEGVNGPVVTFKDCRPVGVD